MEEQCLYWKRSPFLADQHSHRFKSDCLNFLTELCLQIKQRFSFDEKGIIARLKVLDPNIASGCNSPLSIASLAGQFQSLVPLNKLNDLDDEYRSFRITKELHGIDNNITIPEFWYNLRNIKDGLDKPKFENLSHFMTNLTVLPHSSACVERIFSQVNSVKTKFTNRLKAATTRDRILAKQQVTKHNNTCVSWQPKKELVNDIEDGAAYRRYSGRLKDAKNDAKMMTIYEDMDTE